MVFFVGDKASKKNLDAKIPFVGTKSYRTLLSWIAELDVDLTEVVLANREHVKMDYSEPVAETPSLYTTIDKGDAVIALGEKASQHLDKLKIHHFKLPHPSGLNRKANDKKWLKGELKKCRGYIHE